jgi:hypothetical protein
MKWLSARFSEALNQWSMRPGSGPERATDIGLPQAAVLPVAREP